MKDLLRYYIDMDFDWILAALVTCAIVSAILCVALCFAAKRGDEMSRDAYNEQAEETNLDKL